MRLSLPLRWLLLGGLWIACLAFAPEVSLLFIGVNAALMLLLFGGRLYATGSRETSPRRSDRDDQPFVSIHVPTYNEPPEIVAQTLEALGRLDYDNYEVIVLDNNTDDRSFWQPIEAFCAKAGPHFRFCHIDHLEGYKAGALNVTRRQTNEEAEFILVIDADYQVEPQLLQEAVAHFADDDVALVQFPQAYMNVCDDNDGLGGDYAHYFQVYMNLANRLNSVLSTGTVSMLRVRALDDVGGWSDTTITEDAELGLRLKQGGYRTSYVPSVLGRGLMPSDLRGLRSQRERWAFGNAQTLLQLLEGARSRVSLSQQAGIVLQLTAWFNLLLVPVVTLIAAGIFIAASPAPIYETIALAGVGSIWLHVVLQFVFYRLALRSKPIKTVISAFLVHLGLLWEGATSWVSCFLGQRLGFKRTNKFLKDGAFADFLPGVTVFALVFGSGLLIALSGSWGIAIVVFATSPIFLSVLHVWRQIRCTYRVTKVFYERGGAAHTTANLSRAA